MTGRGRAPLVILPLALGGAGLVFVCALRVSASDGAPNAPYLSALPADLESFMPVPATNPLSPAKVALGRRLFFDPRLSRDGTVSCATCHRPELAFSDGRARAVGVGGSVGRRNTPSLVNCAYRRPLFWDGRSASLEAQALLPIENPFEMGHSIPAVLDVLRRDPDIVRDFSAAFGSRDITETRLARALASFERTIVARGVAFDGAARLEPAARRGLALFEGRARCHFCHEGTQLTDGRFHNTGVGWGRRPLDLGRFEITRVEADRGRFRTPSLRGAVHTAPYMHDGSLATLRDVVDFYDRGAGPNPHLDPMIRPLGLSEAEKDDLVRFLRCLAPRG